MSDFEARIPGVQLPDDPIPAPEGFVETTTSQVEEPQAEEAPMVEQTADTGIVNDIVGATAATAEEQVPPSIEGFEAVEVSDIPSEQDPETLDQVKARVQAALDDFRNQIQQMEQGIDPHPVKPVTVEEIDALMAEIDILIANASGDELADNALQDARIHLDAMRTRILSSQAEDVIQDPDAAEAMDAAAPVETPVQESQEVPAYDANWTAAAPQAEETPELPADADVVETPAPEEVATVETAEEANEALAALDNEGATLPVDGQAPQHAEVEDPVETPVAEANNEPSAAVEETVQVTEEVVMPVEDAVAQPVKVEGRVVKGNRADTIYTQSGVVVRPIFSPALKYFIGEYMRSMQVSDTFEIGSTVIRSTKGYGLWEEGGATGISGSVLLLTDPDGRKLPCVTLFYDPKEVNGRHALVQVWDGCYLIMGGHNRGRQVMAIYKIVGNNDTRQPGNDKNGQPNRKFVVEMIGYGTSADELVLEDGIICPFSTVHPAWKKAWERIYEQYTALPAYVRDYTEINAMSSDVQAAAGNAEFMAKMEIENDLAKAYEKIAETLGGDVWYESAGSEFSPTLYMISNYFPQQKCVALYMLAVNFDREGKTSAGHYHRCLRTLIREGETFYYPDKDPDQYVMYENLVRHITRQGGTVTNAFRRSTPFA